MKVGRTFRRREAQYIGGYKMVASLVSHGQKSQYYSMNSKNSYINHLFRQKKVSSENSSNTRVAMRLLPNKFLPN